MSSTQDDFQPPQAKGRRRSGWPDAGHQSDIPDHGEDPIAFFSFSSGQGSCHTIVKSSGRKNM
jgi:hypothetical protein